MKFENIQNREEYSQHLLLLCRIFAWYGLLLGFCWFVFFVLTQRWYLSISLLVLGVTIFPCWLIARKGYFSFGLILAQFECATFVCWFSLLFDIPDAIAPRTTHLYLLVIVFVGYLNFQRSRSISQLLVTSASLFAFLFLCATATPFFVDAPMPQDFRSAGAWINVIFATIMLCGGIIAMQANFRLETRKATELRTALSSGQFELFYQAQVRADGKLLGAEALIRWNHPKRGYISPSEFIPLAQRIGFMPTIGAWVIGEACNTLARWQNDPQTSGLTLSINITADHFVFPDFVDDLLRAASSRSVNPKLLKLELTESVFLSNIEKVIAKMNLLNQSGFSIVLDDFGTGYSSLSYLRQLPLKQLKIDRSFVTGISKGGRLAAITKNIVRMGNDLFLDVLAEGVETEEELGFMLSYGCTMFQGFLFSKPVKLMEFEKYASLCSMRRNHSPRQNLDPALAVSAAAT